MKIIVFSDSHRYIGYMYDAIETEKPDVIVHLGDCYTDAEELAAVFDQKEFYYVPGNCDYNAFGMRQTILVEIDGVRIYMTHGHMQEVKRGLSILTAEATSMEADIALFGHTHESLLHNSGRLILMNPGCASRNGRSGYGIIEIKDGRPHCYIRELY